MKFKEKIVKMKKKELPENLTDEDIMRLIKSIAEPTYKFFMKRIDKELFTGYYKNMSINCFITIFMSAMANTDGNLMRWLAAFYQTKIGKEAPLDNFKNHFWITLNEHINTKIGKN
jgi:hypothetical protein